jgi:BirA family transcriptional regulator, biotin operon repressor / biotin---[acetyl-CoA-carboxylase] ligase
MANEELLKLLASGEFCSGQVLADALGVSRTAVWKQLNKVSEELGLNIESVKGKGYRIPGGVDLLEGSAVKSAMSTEAATLMSALEVLTVIDSTNSEALRHAENGAGAGYVCTAEQQTAGRGRRGRQWVSPFASNLYISVLWQYEQGAAVLEGLSLAVGVAVSRALADCGVTDTQLKWPNDILHDGAKLGGILLEMTGDAAGSCQVVVGIGLNVAMQPESAAAIDQAWTDLSALQANSDDKTTRSELLARVLNHLLPLLASFEQTGFAPWQQSFVEMDALLDQPVVLDSGARKLAGVSRGVDDRGALQLETTTGVQSIYGGEVSLRAAS